MSFSLTKIVSRIKLAAVVCGGVVAALMLIVNGLANSEIQARQVSAIALRPSSAAANGLAAESAYISGHFNQSALFAQRALSAAPMDAKALRTLGLADDRLGETGQAVDFMNLAAKLTWRDTATQLWLLRSGIVAGDFVGIVQRGDALLRRGVMADAIFNLFGRISSVPAGRDALVDALGDDPSWRYKFLNQLPADTPEEIGRAVGVFVGLRSAHVAAEPEEVAPFLRKLVDRGQGPLALGLWRRLGGTGPTADNNLVVDGNFTAQTSDDPSDVQSIPFGWQLVDSSDVSVERGAADDGRPALLLDDGGEGTAATAYQYLALAPQAYRLSFLSQSDTANGLDQLRIRLTCWPSQQVLADLPPQKGGGGWRSTTVDVAVPAACNTQRLAIAIAPSDHIEDANIAVTNVSLTPVG